jgi:ABC-type multidrug transport system ATPase subunit
LGYVPQDDIVHKELTVERTFDFACKLRLPRDIRNDERARLVEQVMTSLGLDRQANQRVGSLSGGQRKRVSIGVELLTNPGVFFLDEPTSGLDPARSREMMWLLRGLAETGSTVILTTHAPQDIYIFDKVAFLAHGGNLAFFGTPSEALNYFGVDRYDEIYERLEDEKSPVIWVERFRGFEVSNDTATPTTQSNNDAIITNGNASRRIDSSTSLLRQWAVLSHRNFEILKRNPLTLGILFGTPLAVILMFALLFRGGAFNLEDPNPSSALMIIFWLAFGSFFFGLSYGLLEISSEFPIFYRERLVNLKILPYVLSKVTVLLPVLAFVALLMLLILRVSDRLPSLGADAYGQLMVTLLLGEVSALAFGLLTSAAMATPQQATLAMPMICFPQVLFAGVCWRFQLWLRWDK